MSEFKHNCPDWDDMEIDIGMPEFESCTCYCEQCRFCILRRNKAKNEAEENRLNPPIYGEWISVKDQLPENNKRILACGYCQCGSCYPKDRLVIEMCHYENGYFEFGGYDCELKATHWMPLPAPPKDIK